MQQLTGQAYIERYGHAWDTADTARAYVERVDREADQRAEAFRVMTSLMPFDKDQAIRVLDIGTGQGNVAAVVLDAFPRSTAVGLDVSEPMMEIARERMAGYGARFRYVLGDFVDGTLPAELDGTFDVVVSSRAIHHLPTANKQRLYRELFARVNPGGCLFNVDSVVPGDDFLREQYRAASRVLRGEPRSAGVGTAYRGPTAGHYWETLDQHLGLLTSAGFRPVDCFWRRLGMTLMGGYKPR